ncbi:MAG: MFS transporter [Clostridiaceae bacterium]|jgi:MFS family permease|nr:MFS transporter [Clostridiaceae bacterium]
MNEQSGYRKWTALVAAFLIMAGPYSIINTIHSLFIHPVVNQYGFSLKSFSFVFTLSAIVIALASPAVGRAVGTIGLRPVMVLGALLAGGGFFAYGFARSIAAFYGIAAVVALGGRR